MARDRRMELDALPPDLPGRVQELQQYDWMDDAARERFEQLLQQLADALLEDMDLRWQVDELARNLQNAFPNMPWGQRMNFSGDEAMPLSSMAGMLEQISDMDTLEQMMRNATEPGQLAEVDPD